MSTKLRGRAAAALLAMLLPLTVCEASGPTYYTPEFFATSYESRALLAGRDFSTRGSFARTLLYLHLSGHFTQQHEELFEHYLDRPRPERRDYPAFTWRQAAVNAGGSNDAVDTNRLISRRVTRGTRVFTERYYVDNCLDDAFVTAVATLNERQQLYGGDSPQFRRWLQAQQQVFANCSAAELSLPPPAEGSWDALEKQDRAYQLAASYFYGLQYARSIEAFRAIAADSTSPWAEVSRYLVARCFVREALINGNDVEENLRSARALYLEMETDENFRQRFPSVSGLVRFLDIRLDQPAVVSQLALQVLEQPARVDVAALNDFLFLTENGPGTLPSATENELIRWHRLAKDSSLAGFDEIAELWQDTRNPAWLYLALQKQYADGRRIQLNALAEDLDDLDPSTPGYADMLIRAATLLQAGGDEQGAANLARRSLGDDSLNLEQKHRNRFQYLLAGLSESPSGYLRAAQLRPVALRTMSTGFVSLDAEALRLATRGSTLFTDETVTLIDAHFTPDMLLDAVLNVDLNDYLEGRLLIAAWVKSLLLNDEVSAQRAARLLQSVFPELAPELERSLQSEDGAFAAASIIMTHPGFTPWIPPGIGRYRHAELNRVAFASAELALPNRGSNWWCNQQPAGDATEADVTGSIDRLRRERPFFRSLPEEQLERMVRMPARLQQSATEFFGPVIIDHARRSPDDPRVPQALHRLVFATRYACQTGPGDVSRAAFDLLHRQYPDSEWTRRTPYWYQ